MTLRADAPASGGAATTPEPTEPRTHAIRRNTLLLAAAQGTSSMSFSVLLIVGSVAASDLAGHDGAVGVMNGLYFLAAAGGALAFGRWMDRVGRRPGLALPDLLLAVSGPRGGGVVPGPSRPGG